jgi:hypothetical protein
MKRVGIPLIALFLLSMPAYGIDRVTLGVVCQLVEKRYLQNLRDEEVAAIEKACAERLSRELDATLAFLHFVADSNQVNRLVVRLGKDDSVVRPVDFAVWVEGNTVQGDAEPVIWPFRTVDEWLQIPTAEAFPDEIQLQFTDALRKNADSLVNLQLSRVAIADSAVPLPDDQSWRMPFTREELTTQDDSEFGIKARLDMPDDSQERYVYDVKLKGDFSNGAKVLHLRDDTFSLVESLERLRRAENIEVIYVVVKHYVPLQLPAATLPTDLVLDNQGASP